MQSRWQGWPFLIAHQKVLREASTIYTHVPDFSLQLGRAGHPHLLEACDSEPLVSEGLEARLLEPAPRST